MHFSLNRKLNQSGFDHIMVAVACFVIVGIVGVALIVRSHAATTTILNAPLWTGRLEAYSNNSGYCLTTATISNALSGANGAYAVLEPCSATYNAEQVWTAHYATTLTSGSSSWPIFNLQSAAGANQCLNDWDLNTTNGFQMRLDLCGDVKANGWHWSTNYSKVTTNTAQVYTSHQLLNYLTEKCLDVGYNSTKPNTKIDQYTCKYTTQSSGNQQWYVDAAPAKSATSATGPSTWSGELQNGVGGGKLCMNASSVLSGSNFPVVIGSCTNSVAAMWFITKNSSNQFLLENGGTSCAYNLSATNQSNVSKFSCVEPTDQGLMWEWNGKQIENVTSKECIEDTNSSTTSGTPLTVASCSGDPPNQQWTEAVLGTQ